MSTVTFSCGRLTLEGAWQIPESKKPLPCVVVCHPHPLNGGDMENSVVTTICQALYDRGIASFRFNFRGVGHSEGYFGGGPGEQEDLKAALTFIRTPKIDAGKIGLAGYSFGAGVVLGVAVQDDSVKALALVSPALREDAWEQLHKYQSPKLIVVGDEDNSLQRVRFEELTTTMREDCQVVHGADHFWFGYEEDLGNRVSRFFFTNL